MKRFHHNDVRVIRTRLNTWFTKMGVNNDDAGDAIQGIIDIIQGHPTMTFNDLLRAMCFATTTNHVAQIVEHMTNARKQ